MTERIIHAASLFEEGEWIPLLLREKTPDHYAWFKGTEELGVDATTPEEACKLLRKAFKGTPLSFYNCGFRFTLPERDETGTNALFYQMEASYNSPTGIYYDEELQASCIVRFASEEARELLKKVTSS